MSKSTQWVLLAVALLVIPAVGVLLGVTVYRWWLVPPTGSITPVSSPAPVAIVSGFIQYNGIRPEAGSTTQGRVVLYARELGSSEFSQLPLIIGIGSHATWSWSQAEQGKTYQIQAGMELAGAEVARSNMIVVTAPASGEQLTFNVSRDQVPPELFAPTPVESEWIAAEVLPTPQLLNLAPATPSSAPTGTSASPRSTISSPAPLSSPSPLPVAVSGRLNLSGYLPPAARLVLKAAPEGGNYQVVTTDIEVKDNAVWIWPGATAGQRYRLQLELRAQDVILGRSEEVTVAAPATNQYLQLVSTAQPLQTASQTREAILGKIDLNGPVANNSSILILLRRPGETVYQPVVRIPAADGQTWSYDNALAGQLYEMTAALQVNEQNTSTANAVTVTAPAANVLFRINTNVSLDAPGSPQLLSCGSRKPDGKWPAELVFPHVANANSYWLQVGSQAGLNDVYNERRVRSKTNEEKVVVDLENNKTYYVRYAQAQCSDCRSDQDYSGFSTAAQVKCGE